MFAGAAYRDNSGFRVLLCRQGVRFWDFSDTGGFTDALQQKGSIRPFQKALNPEESPKLHPKLPVQNSGLEGFAVSLYFLHTYRHTDIHTDRHTCIRCFIHSFIHPYITYMTSIMYTFITYHDSQTCA